MKAGHLIALFLAAVAADAAAMQLGTGSGETWTTGLQYPPITAHVGDSLVFRYDRGEHNVVQISAPSCDLPNPHQLASLTQSPYSLTFNQTGAFYYACSVAGHCSEGMLLTVHVIAPAPAQAPMYQPATLQLGPSDPEGTWTTGLQYPPVSAHVSDRLEFSYLRGQHNVVQISGPSCDLPNAHQLASLTDSPFYLTFNQTGTFYYACSVPSHCADGMLLTVHVTEPPLEPQMSAMAPAEVPQVAIKPSRKKPPTQGDSFCGKPELVNGTTDTFKVSCLGPGIPLAPGQVANDYYTLASPYPERLVAVISQQSQIVDSTGRSVPLSEAYCHHFFGPSSLIAGEGAELRGSIDRLPLPPPYYPIVNGMYWANPSARTVNIHLINTLGVESYDVAPCIECWCRDSELQASGYYGGTACCTPENCQSGMSHMPPTVYKLQYNITYQYPDNINITQTHLQLMDVVNGNVEYDVHAGLPGSEDVRNFTTTIDSHCPQLNLFELVRCTGHQHIGGICMELYDTDTNDLICNSCAEYGNSSSVADPGQEHGYLVKMTDDTMDPPYPLEPGQNVTLVSRYDSSVDHYGVMALYILSLANWDASCPGSVTAEAPSPTDGGFSIFQYFVGDKNASVPDAATYS